MSMEVEAKAYCDKLSEIEQRVIEMGGEFQEEVTQEDIYFNHPAWDFAQTDEALRVRKVAEDVFFTYKGPKIDDITKTREEIVVGVEDEIALKEILVKLGFSEAGMVKKVRRKYRFSEFKVCLDDVQDLGSFVELEAEVHPDDPNEISRLRDDILKILSDWGLEKIERRSYLELLLEP